MKKQLLLLFFAIFCFVNYTSSYAQTDEFIKVPAFKSALLNLQKRTLKSLEKEYGKYIRPANLPNLPKSTTR